MANTDPQDRPRASRRLRHLRCLILRRRLDLHEDQVRARLARLGWRAAVVRRDALSSEGGSIAGIG